MKYIQVAYNALQLPAVGYGCLQLSFPNAADQATVDQMILTAFQQGVRVFDTAASYGMDRHNEILLGNALKKLPNNPEDKPFIMTKCGISFADGGTFEASPDQIRESVELSLKHLQVDVIDCLYLHRIDGSADAATFAKTIHAMKMLVKEGKVKYLGLSEPTALQLKATYQVEPLDVPITFAEVAYSIFTRRAEINGLIDACNDLNVNVVAYTATVRGATDARLLQVTENDFNTLNDNEFQQRVFSVLGIEENDFSRRFAGFFDSAVVRENTRQLIAFQRKAQDLQVSPTQLALAWLAHYNVISIPGTTNLAHLTENNATLQLDIPAAQLEALSLQFPVGCFKGNPNPKGLEKLDNPVLEMDARLKSASASKSTGLTMDSVRNITLSIPDLDTLDQTSANAVIAHRIDPQFAHQIARGEIPEQGDNYLAVSLAISTKKSAPMITAAQGANCNEQTTFNLNSISKFISMMMIMRLVDMKKIRLSDTLDQYVKDDRIRYKHQITIRQLLDHRSGLSDADFFITVKRDELTKLLDLEHQDEPRDHFQYANVNFFILGHVIEAAVPGVSFSECFKQLIKNPLNLTGTYLVGDEDALPVADGFKYISAQNQLVNAKDVIMFAATQFRSNPTDVAIMMRHFFEDEQFISKGLRQLAIASCVDVNFKVVTKQHTYSWPCVAGLGLERRVSASGVVFGHGGWSDSHAGHAFYNPSKQSTACVLVSKTGGLDQRFELEKLKAASRQLADRPNLLGFANQPTVAPNAKASEASEFNLNK